MCGIAGTWGTPGGESLQHTAKSMADAIAHRGPDDSGEWFDADAALALAHRRLSVIDTSFAGHQPMVSKCGRYVIVYNGEIYNHLDIREELEAADLQQKWVGHSDTETLIEAVAFWGVEIALPKCNGMFAFALWDREQRTLTLARDRMGEKPLYFGVMGGTFIFGSELKALRQHPFWQGEIDRDALALYFRFQYVPAPHSIFRDVHKLRPGHFITVSWDAGPQWVEKNYWDIQEQARLGISEHSTACPDERIEELHSLLNSAVASRMIADVPLGAFLSGGYDSGLVVALMQRHSAHPVRTYTIGFDEQAYNEAPYAKQVAAHLGTQHEELYVTAEDALSVVPQLPKIWCEPFGDSSQVPTYLVSALASQQLTVALSGDGGDELFYGYSRYHASEAQWQKVVKYPLALRKLMASLLQVAPRGLVGKAMQAIRPDYGSAGLAETLQYLCDTIAHDNPRLLYRGRVSHSHSPGDLVLGSKPALTVFDDKNELSIAAMMQLIDMQTYLPDDILVKVDRASMARSLETRAPLLDHRLVEFAWRIPSSMNVNNGAGKHLIKQIAHRYLPKQLMDRPKIGFGVPVGEWLRGPLKPWAEELLGEQRLASDGYLNVDLVRAKWLEHQKGRRNWQYHLWDLLMFQSWLDEQARFS